MKKLIRSFWKTLLGIAIVLTSYACRADQYAIVDGSGNITNVIEWDGVSQYVPPAGTTIHKSDGTAARGGTYDGEEFSPPSIPTSAPTEQ